MIAALALGGVVLNLVQGRQAQFAQATAETQLLSAPDLRSYAVPLNNGGQASFVVSRQLNRAMFVSAGLPPTAADQTYQVWTLKSSAISPDNPSGAAPDVLVPGGGDRKVFLTGSLDGVTGLGVSVEDAGGAPLPTLTAIKGIHRALRPDPRRPRPTQAGTRTGPVESAAVSVGRGRLSACLTTTPITAPSAGPRRATLEKRHGEVAAMFDRVAGRYDLANDVLSLGQDRAWRRLVLRATDPRPGQLILDLAAGTGTSSQPFADAGATVIPTDLSLGMLTVGKRRLPGLSFVAGDALRLPYADASFDAVTVSFGLRNVEDPRSALAEMLRVTRPGGVLVVCEFSTPTWRPFRLIYANYLVAALPKLARVISSNPAAYEYLAESIQAWPDQAGLAALIEGSGWRQVEWQNASGGIVALHRARA